MKKKINLRELKLKKLRFKRIRFRVILIVLGIVATVLIAFNFWFLDHSERALERIVERQSKGNIELVVEEFNFNWITNHIELKNAVLRTKDSTAATQYLFKSDRLTIKAIGFLPLLFNRILIDSIHIYSPDVIVTKVQETANRVKDTTINSEDFSVAKEIGRVTNTINNAIRELKINRFILDNGSFSLLDKVKPNETPFLVDNIDIRLYNLQVDSTSIAKTEQKQQLQFTDEIAIETSNQNIIFPGGTNFLSFKNFKVTLRDQKVTFDSCTYRSIKGDSSRTAANIFFDELKLTGIDFNAFYSSELIKADSVFCLNPDVFLDVDAVENKQAKNGGEIPKIDSVIKSLFGDLQLNHLIVRNADINVNTYRKGNVNKFVSKDNQIEIEGFSIDRKAAKPVNIDRFLLYLYNYKTTLNDGKYAFAFDSLKFLDKSLNLYNFSFQEYANRNRIKNLMMDKFELRDISWEALIYENRFEAKNAHFFNPNIELTTGQGNNKQPKNIFETLNSIDESMNLNDLRIVNGDILVHLKNGGRLQLYNTDLSLYPNELTSSTRIKNLQRSVEHLSTQKLVFSKSNTNVVLNNLKLANNNNGLTAADLYFKNKNINASLNGILINTVLLDEYENEIELNGLRWNNARVSVKNTRQNDNTGKQASAGSAISMNDIRGRNTRLSIDNGKQNIDGYFEVLDVDKVALLPDQKPAIFGLQFQGRDFIIRNPVQLLSIGRMHISDNSNSVINDITYRKVDAKDSILGTIPQVTIIPDITQIINGNIHVNNIVVDKPEVYARLGRKDSTKQSKENNTTLSFGSVLVKQPNVQLVLEGKEPSFISWQGDKYESYVQVNNFQSGKKIPASADLLKIYLTYFEFINSKSKRIATNDNKLNLEFENILFEKDDEDSLHWRTTANILSLDQLKFDSLGKKNITVTLDKGDVRNITLNSRYPKAGDIIKNSTDLLMTGTSGSVNAINNFLRWDNLQYKNGYFSIDSFGMQPHQPLEEYRIEKAFNQDHLTIKTGLITGGPVDRIKYFDDSILAIGGIKVNDATLRTAKDKTQTDTATQTKPLFTRMIKNIPSKVAVDSLALSNMYVEYWEFTDKTDTLVIIPVSNLHASMYHIKNHNLTTSDSLLVFANGNVLNKLHTQLSIQQSYTDTLDGYNMQLKTGPVDLKAFNRLLIPIAGFAVSQGMLDSLTMTAFANNDYAKGEMKMYYENLKLQILDKKDLPNQKFYHKLASWLANLLVIRTNNNGKASPVFAERLKEKSAINQIIKAALSGLKSSVGLPGAKRQERKYFKTINSEAVKQ